MGENISKIFLNQKATTRIKHIPNPFSFTYCDKKKYRKREKCNLYEKTGQCKILMDLDHLFSPLIREYKDFQLKSNDNIIYSGYCSE